MRILATFAFSFSIAIFAAAYLPLDSVLLPLGGGLALAALLAGLLSKRARRLRRLRGVLILSGLAAGLLWTSAYSFFFFRPAQALDGRTVRLSASVSGWPQAGTYGGFSLPVRVETDSGVPLTAVLYLDGQGEGLRPGDRIETIAHCTLGSRTFAGEEITYYTAKGIFLRATAYGRLSATRPDRLPLRDWPAVLSQTLKTGINAAFPPDAAPLVRALVTGNRDNLTDEFTTSLQRTGLSHTVAVSGMHLAFLADLLSRLLGKGKRSTALFTVLWTALFCGVAGYTPSVLRAAVMILMLQAAPLLGRERDGATSLALALMLLLAWNPFSAAHVGLQLSFSAVAGILLASDAIQARLLSLFHLDARPRSSLSKWLRTLPYFIVSTLSATLGASLLTVPLAALHFHTVSLISPLSNLATLWAIGLIFLAGLAAGLAGSVLPALGAALALPILPLVRYLGWVVDLLARPAWAALPMTSVYCLGWLVFVYLLAAATAILPGRKRAAVPLCAGILTLALALSCTVLEFYRGELTAAVLDVGQGQSILLRLGRHLTLVDCGGDSAENPGDIAAGYLQSAGRSSLDLLVVSHCHADHANGIPQLLRRIRVSVLALPDAEEDSPLRREILSLAREQGTQVRFIREDTVFDLGERGSLTLFAPPDRGSETNELCLSVLAGAGENQVLLTGDMSGEGEQLLLSRAALPDLTLLVAGHHGARTSTTPELLEAVRPELAVVSVGKNNRYGHPARETLERLAGSGAQIYRTDLHGNIVVRLNSKP